MTNSLNYDYDNQAWVKDGKYLSCCHPESMQCKCFGKLHKGETRDMIESIFIQLTCLVCYNVLDYNVQTTEYKCGVCGWYPKLDDEMIRIEEWAKTQLF